MVTKYIYLSITVVVKKQALNIWCCVVWVLEGFTCVVFIRLVCLVVELLGLLLCCVGLGEVYLS